jgi:hypothetical protein
MPIYVSPQPDYRGPRRAAKAVFASEGSKQDEKGETPDPLGVCGPGVGG